MLLLLILLSTFTVTSLTLSLMLCLLKRRRLDEGIATDGNISYSISAHSSPIHDGSVTVSPPADQQPVGDDEYAYVFHDRGLALGGSRSTLPSMNSKKRPDLVDAITTGGSVRGMHSNDRKVDFDDMYACLKQIKAEKEAAKAKKTPIDGQPSPQPAAVDDSAAAVADDDSHTYEYMSRNSTSSNNSDHEYI